MLQDGPGGITYPTMEALVQNLHGHVLLTPVGGARYADMFRRYMDKKDGSGKCPISYDLKRDYGRQ